MLLFVYILRVVDSGKGFIYKIKLGDAVIGQVRLFCAYILHLMIITEITQARNMVSFAKKNISAFKRKQFIYPMLFGFFKLIAGFVAAGTNTIVLMQQEDVVDAIKDFISIAVIFEIDNIIATTV